MSRAAYYDPTCDCPLCRAHAEIARLTVEVAKAREEEREAAAQFMDSVTRGLYLRARSTGGEEQGRIVSIDDLERILNSEPKRMMHIRPDGTVVDK